MVGGITAIPVIPGPTQLEWKSRNMFRILTVGLSEKLTAWLKERLVDTIVSCTDNGDEALRILARGGYSMLILDHQGSDHSPEGLVSQVRHELMLKDLPVLYCLEQGLGTTLSSRLLGSLGVKQLLFHPIDREELAQQIAQVLALSLSPARSGGASSGHDQAEVTRRSAPFFAPTLLLLDRSEGPFHAVLNDALVELGVELIRSKDLAEAQRSLVHAAPAMILLDSSFLDEEAVDRKALGAFIGRSRGTPLLVLDDEGTLAKHLEAVRLGARGLFEKQLPLVPILDAIQAALAEPRSTPATVLMLGAAPTFPQPVQAVLSDAGYRVSCLQDPEQFWDALDAQRPDLVVLDSELPGDLSGLELCRVLRTIARYDGISVIVLTGQSDPATIRGIFAAGADTYASKPVVGYELIAHFGHQLERKKRLLGLPDRDPSSGLTSRKGAIQLLQRYFHLSKRHGQTALLAMIKVDISCHGAAESPLSDTILTRVGERLSQSIRGEDVVARWSENRFLIGMYGISQKHGIKKISSVLGQLETESFATPDGQRYAIKAHAGLALYPDSGTTLQGVCKAAEKALAQAMVSDRSRVQVAGWSSEKPLTQVVDVAIVDDDESLAALLQKVLQTQGYQTHWFPDGEAAVKALAGSNPEVAASLLLLDLSLPGMDGLSVLKQYSRDGGLASSRVIVMSANSQDSAVLSALELGAFDYVSKPFNVGVLIQRVQRALKTPASAGGKGGATSPERMIRESDRH